MDVRPLKLSDYYLHRIRFSCDVSSDFANEQSKRFEFEGGAAHHLYTVDGEEHIVGLYLSEDRDEDGEGGLFAATFHRAESLERYGPKLTRSELTKLLEQVEAEREGNKLFTDARFFFPKDDYLSPLIPSQLPLEYIEGEEQAEAEISESGQLVPTGIRYSSEDGVVRDVIVDASAGPVSLNLILLFEGAILGQKFKDHFRSIHRLSSAFVTRTKGEEE